MADVARLEALFDERGIRGVEPRPVTEADGAAADAAITTDTTLTLSGTSVARPSASCASTRPTAGESLKPWPEKPQAVNTLRQPGSGPARPFARAAVRSSELAACSAGPSALGQGVAQAWRQQLDRIEQTLAAQVAEVAIALARQVVRGEISVRPEQVAVVAQEALAATLVAARMPMTRKLAARLCFMAVSHIKLRWARSNSSV